MRASMIVAAVAALAGCGGASQETQVRSLLLESRQPTPQPAQPAAQPAQPGTAASGAAQAGAVPGALPGAAAPVVPAALNADQAKDLSGEGLSLLRSGNVAEGREKLLRAAGSGVADAVTFYNLAIADRLAGDRDSAESHAQRAVDLSNGSQKAVDLLASIMLADGRPDLLGAAFRALADAHPDSMPIQVGLARAKIAQGHAAEALRDATDLLRKDEANIDVMKTIAKAYMAMERIEAAQFVLGQVLEIKKDAEAYDLLGQMALKAGDTPRATSLFQSAIGLNPGFADAHNNIGVIYHLAGDDESAIVEFEAALKAEPSYAMGWMNLGNAYRKLQRFEAAIDSYKHALKVNPDCADCFFNLGVAELENKGTGKDEPGHYRRALDYLTTYKQMFRAPRRDEDADKYSDEARRMADILEKEQEQMRKAPRPEPVPATDAGAPADGP